MMDSMKYERERKHIKGGLGKWEHLLVWFERIWLGIGFRDGMTRLHVCPHHDGQLWNMNSFFLLFG